MHTPADEAGLTREEKRKLREERAYAKYQEKLAKQVRTRACTYLRYV